MIPKNRGDGGSVTQKRPPAPLPDTVRAKKNSSTPVASDTTSEKDGPDRNRCDLTMRHKSEPDQNKDMTNHRLSIYWRSGSNKNQFLTSLMTISVRKVSFTIGVGV